MFPCKCLACTVAWTLGLLSVSAHGDMVVTKSAAPPDSADVLLAFDTWGTGSQNLLLWDRGGGAESAFGQTFRFDRPVNLDKITIKVLSREDDLSGRPVELWLGRALHHATDSRLTSLLAAPQADLPDGVSGNEAWYLTLDFDNLLLSADMDYGFMPRFASGGGEHDEAVEAFLWAMGRYAYDDGAAFRLTPYPGNSTLLNNELVFFVHGKPGVDGDFDGDGLWNCADIDALVSEVVAGTHDAAFDMNGDGFVTGDDVTDTGVGWLAVAGANNTIQTEGNPYLVGDATLDGLVDVSDFNIWNGHKFTATPSWCSGDFNADGLVDVSDFNLWNAQKFTASGAAVVPEPAPPGYFILLMIFACGRLCGLFPRIF